MRVALNANASNKLLCEIVSCFGFASACEYVYMCLYAYVHVCERVYFFCVYLYLRVCVYVFVFVSVCENICAFMYPRIHVCMYVCMYVCMCIVYFVSVCACA